MKQLFTIPTDSKVIRCGMRGLWLLLTGIALMFSPGVCMAESTAKEAAATEFVKTEIYLGRNLPDGHEVSEWEFREFVDKVATKYFPKGLTIFNAYGQMQHKSARIEKQSTWVMIIVHDKSTKNADAVKEIINAYRKQFGRLQVMHLASPVSATFYAE